MAIDITVLPLSFRRGGADHTIFPVLICPGGEYILVDGGYEGFLPLLEQAAGKYNISLSSITGLIITHHDIDHMGCAHEIVKNFPSIKIYTSAIEVPYVSGQKKSLRLQQAEDIFPDLPEEYKADALEFQRLLQSMKPVVVNHIISENGELDFLKGVFSVHTPGHMPGHISLYIPETKTLVAADALVIENGELEIANPSFTLDIKAAIGSVKKIAGLKIEKLICYHGGMMETGIDSKLRGLLKKYEMIAEGQQ
jgi:glyoxylase-like metal-dependent hydrolase (beta-lactamase superfamily II)